MRVKNVSAKQLDLEDFNLSIGVGEIGDLSDFDPKLLHQHKRLNAMFDKGLLVNLGTAGVTGSNKSLISARDRISKLGLEGYVPKKSKSSSKSSRSKIADLMKKSDRRAPIATEPQTAHERYSRDFQQNMNPTEKYDEEFEKPRIKIDEKFRTVKIGFDGAVVTDFGENGNIQTGILSKEPIINKSLIQVTDKSGQEYNVSLERIEERLKRKCLGSNKSGKPCKKWAVKNYDSCLTHLSHAEKKSYENLKKTAR